MPEVFKLRATDGSVVPIRANSPEDAFSILDEIEGGKLSAVQSKFGVTPPSAETATRFGKRIVSNVGDLAKGAVSMGLDAAKSALTLEGQASYLPRLAKGMYDGAVQYGADAIARQLPNGAEEATPGQMVKAGIAAVPVVGGYAMNRATDVAEGKAPEAIADVVTDAATMMVPGSGPGRAGLARTMSGATRAAEATATGLGKAAVKVGPEITGMVAGGAISGGLGGIAGGMLAHEAKAAVVKWLQNRFKVPAKIAEDLASKMKPEQAALIAEREAILEAKQMAAVEDKVFRREVADAKKQAGFDRKADKIRPIPPNKLPPVLPDPVVPELAPPPVKVSKPKPAPRVKAEPAKAPELAPVTAQVPPQAPVPPQAAPLPSEPSAQTRIAKYYNLHPERSATEGTVGIHPTLGLPMNAEGKVMVRNAGEFDTARLPGQAPEGDVVWRDPNRSYFGNPSVQEMADILEARANAKAPALSLEEQIRAARKPEMVDRMKVPAQTEQQTAEFSDRIKNMKTGPTKAEIDAEKAGSSDIVTAPPAFHGQQSAKGATKSRFEDVAKRTATGWMQSGKTDAFIQDKLVKMFNMTPEDAANLIRQVGGK